MKRLFGVGLTGVGIVALLAVLGGPFLNNMVTAPAAAQNPSAAGQAGGGELDRLESGIRASNPGAPGAMAIATGQHAYLGAIADDDAGRGVRVLSVHSGGPADQAGLQAQDLIVAAAGRKIHLLSELSTIINHLNPGDRLSLELQRGNRPFHVDAVLSAAPAVTAPVPRLGAERTQSIPPPPGEFAPPSSPAVPNYARERPPPPNNSGIPSNPGIPPPPSSPALLPPPEGPTFAAPNQPAAPNSPQAQIDELRRRVDELERKVQSLERALAEPARK